MTNQPINTRSILAFRKKELEDLLLSCQPDLMMEYVETSTALAALDRLGHSASISNIEYSGYRQAIDAIEDYLGKVSEFSSQEVITDALLAGGFAPRDKHRRKNITDSFRYHKKSRRLVERDGLIGKADWLENLKK